MRNAGCSRPVAREFDLRSSRCRQGRLEVTVPAGVKQPHTRHQILRSKAHRPTDSGFPLCRQHLRFSFDKPSSSDRISTWNSGTCVELSSCHLGVPMIHRLLENMNVVRAGGRPDRFQYVVISKTKTGQTSMLSHPRGHRTHPYESSEN